MLTRIVIMEEPGSVYTVGFEIVRKSGDSEVYTDALKYFPDGKIEVLSGFFKLPPDIQRSIHRILATQAGSFGVKPSSGFSPSTLEEEKIRAVAVKAAQEILSRKELKMAEFNPFYGLVEKSVGGGPGGRVDGRQVQPDEKVAKELADIVVKFLKNEISDVEVMVQIKKVKIADIGYDWEDAGSYVYFTSKLARELIDNTNKLLGASSAVVQQKIEEEAAVKRGGIDFTDIEKYLQYDGSFKGIDLSLPLLSKQELEGMDLDKEEEIVRNYLATGYNPHGDRLKRLLAGLFQKDQFTSRQLDLLRLSQNLCSFLSARGLETTPDQRAFILITDTGLFLRQGQGKAAIKPSLN